MNIKIVDSWLRDFLDTKASANEIAKELSLTSVSVERVEKGQDDYIYDIEVTTNRPDLMSVSGIAKEASAALPEQGTPAKLRSRKIPPIPHANISFPIEIKNDPKLVNRIMAVVMEVEIGKSPEKISRRLEQSGIRSLNNVIDVTNYVMREIGHPTHVFDFDLITTKKMIIRESKPGETMTTLDGKQYRLLGGDIVADDGSGQIIDLLGVMGTANSVVQDSTKRIMFFLDNNNPHKIRKTSMSLGIRTEAAIINEKGIDPELMDTAFRRGVALFEEIAKGKVVSKVLDIYPNKSKTHKIVVPLEKIDRVIGVKIDSTKSIFILKNLGFEAKKVGENLEIIVPTTRFSEVRIEEDIIEEISRVYGYHRLPSIVPGFFNSDFMPFANGFYFEEKAKNALKYWGFTEIYTYSLVSEDLFEGPIEKAIKLKNPLTEDMKYLRNSLVPSLLQVIKRGREEVKIFEIANVYEKRNNDLPKETLMLSGVIKKANLSFFEVKGIIEQLLNDLAVEDYKFKSRTEGNGSTVNIAGKSIGYVEILDTRTIDFELNFEEILKNASNKKTYKPIAKFPPVVEDITFIVDSNILTEDLISEIKLQSFLVSDVAFKDQYENSRTFHVIYQASDRNLTSKEVSEIREQIIKNLADKFKVRVK